MTAETERLLKSLATGSIAEAPVLLRYEVANAIVSAYRRRKRLTREQYSSRLRDFDNLPIRYDTDSPSFAATSIAQIAKGHGLTIYDAAYIELALRKGHPIATNDARLKATAVDIGVPVL